MNELMKKKGIALWIGISGVVAVLLSLIVPFVKEGRLSMSLVGIAKLYLTAGSSVWHSKRYETFYKIFVPVMLGLIVLFAILYLVKCIKKRPVGMIVSTVLTVVAFEALKWDFKDRGVVSGADDKGLAFVVIWISYALLVAGIVLTIVEKVKARGQGPKLQENEGKEA